MEGQKEKKYDYDIVILLCAGGPKESNFFTVLEKDDKYLGGPDRMNAAIKIDPQVGKFIVVGGGMKEKNEGKKVNKMREYLVKKGVDKNKIIRIISEAGTLGNFRAIFRCFKENNKIQALKNKRIGILTNFYHIPRTLRFAAESLEIIKEKGEDINGIRFMPIIAESVVKNFTSLYPTELLRQIRSQCRGLADWENHEYDEQNKQYEEWLYKCLDESILSDLH